MIVLRTSLHRIRATIILSACVFLLIIRQPVAEGAWQISGDVALFPRLGNIPLGEPVFEFDASVGCKNRMGGSYLLAASYMEPTLTGIREREKLDVTGVWLMRSASFGVYNHSFTVSAGPGISIIDWRSERAKMLYGSFSFRSDIVMTIWNFKGLSVSLGGSYRSCPLQNSGLITDRFGFVMFITG